MRVSRLTVRNLRGLTHLEIEPTGSVALIGANGAGKSTVLQALSLALGRGGALTAADFADPRSPIEIECVLLDLDDAVIGAFADRLDAVPGQGATLTLGARATIDDGDVDLRVGFPGDWTSASRRALRTLPVMWVDAQRNARRLLELVGHRSILAPMIEKLDLEEETREAAAAVQNATTDLAAAEPLVELFDALSTKARSVLQDAPEDVFGLEGLPPEDLLRHLELLVHYLTFPQPLSRQPSGLLQLAIFSVVLHSVEERPGTIVLVDEPETSLHPQASRALTRQLLASGAQVIAATHSPDVLVRWDVRQIVRLVRDANTTSTHTLSHFDDVSANDLRRYSTNGLAEAFFARTAILVEGPGDRLALNVVAELLKIDIDAAGVSIVELAGADAFSAMARALGDGGLGVRVLGLCDVDREAAWARAAFGDKTYDGDRLSLQARGVYVLDPDIEHVLVDALGLERAEAVIDAAGLGSDLATFRKQPDKRGMSAAESLLRFVALGRHKTTMPARLATGLLADEVPAVFSRLLTNV